MEELDRNEIGVVYGELAASYSKKKKESIINILYCGEILSSAKKLLPHGMFSNFLADPRVAESERTSQRLMDIHRNFGHLLVDPEHKIDVIERLGVSHLLELKKLPARFKKELELEVRVGSRVIKQMSSVVDEKKLAEFLDKNVEYKGEKKHIRDLPVDEMRKYIESESGTYKKPKDDTTKSFSDKLPKIAGGYLQPLDDVEYDPIESKKPVSMVETQVSTIRTQMSDLTVIVNALNQNLITFIDRDDLDELVPDIKSGITREASIVKSRIEGLLMQLINLSDKMR